MRAGADSSEGRAVAFQAAPYGYWRDPLCILACALYALNRFWMKQHFGGVFLIGYFNDLLLIPAALPLVLWLQRRIGVRGNEGRPRWGEIALHLIIWSFVAEAVMPHLSSRSIGDWMDVAAYSAGGLVAGLWWQAPWAG